MFMINLIILYYKSTTSTTTTTTTTALSMCGKDGMNSFSSKDLSTCRIFKSSMTFSRYQPKALEKLIRFHESTHILSNTGNLVFINFFVLYRRSLSLSGLFGFSFYLTHWLISLDNLSLGIYTMSTHFITTISIKWK